MRNAGKAKCIQCGKNREVCCTYATADDGTHTDPICVKCCGPHPKGRTDGVYTTDG